MAEPLVTLQLKTDELKKLGDRIAQVELEKRMVQSALDVLLPIARNEVPRRTGRLRDSIRPLLEPKAGSWQGRIRAMGPGFYGRFLAAGTKPAKQQPIVPRRDRRGRNSRFKEFIVPGGTVITTRGRGSFVSLRLNLASGTIFRRSVRHVGLRANPWPDRTVGRGMGQVAAENERIVRAALDQKGL